MSEDAGLELQKAIKTVLEADSTLATRMGGTVRFYDFVPENTDWPYLEYRSTQNQAWDTDETEAKSGDGEQHTLSLNIWSDYEGQVQSRNILRRCKELLQNNTAMSLTDHALINLRWMFTDVVPEPDGQIYHGIAQFRAVTEEI